MTTARDVIALTYLGGPDAIMDALLSAPDSVRLELAGMLNPWRPIETAPKNGRFIWLSDGFHKRIGFWDFQDDRKGRWVDMARAEAKGASDLPFAPTLWLPLPAPPSEDTPK